MNDDDSDASPAWMLGLALLLIFMCLCTMLIFAVGRGL